MTINNNRLAVQIPLYFEVLIEPEKSNRHIFWKSKKTSDMSLKNID